MYRDARRWRGARSKLGPRDTRREVIPVRRMETAERPTGVDMTPGSSILPDGHGRLAVGAILSTAQRGRVPDDRSSALIVRTVRRMRGTGGRVAPQHERRFHCVSAVHARREPLLSAYTMSERAVYVTPPLTRVH